jgi:hypothetical protein
VNGLRSRRRIEMRVSRNRTKLFGAGFSVFAIAALGLLAGAAPAAAQGCGSGPGVGSCNVKTIELTATVAANCFLELSGTVPTLDLTVSGSATVGSVTENCNAKNGYNIQVKTRNGRKLVGTAPQAEELVYELSYGGQPVTVTAADTFSPKLFPTLAKTAADGVSRDVTIEWEGMYLAEDTYADTITVSLVAP